MFLSSIDTATGTATDIVVGIDIGIDGGTAEYLLPSLQKDLTLLAASLDSRFLYSGQTLGTVVETIDRVIVALDSVTNALDERAAGAAVRDLGTVAERLATLPAAQSLRAGELTTVETMAKTLREQVMLMHQALNVLRIYGVNIKIAASGAAEFVYFVDGMTVTLGAGEQELDAFLATLKELDVTVASAQQGERILSAECAKVVPAVPASLTSDAASLQAHLSSVAKAAQRVSAVAREIQERVAIVLGALQVGDSTRQRLEHVVSALQILDGRPVLPDQDGVADVTAGAQIVSYIYRLLAAQLEAISTDFERDAKLLLASLTALGPDTARLLALIEEDGSADGRTFLHRLERGITEVERLTSQLHEADYRSGLMVDTIASALEALAARLDNLRGIRFDVQMIVVNMRLMSRGCGDTGKAVTVIAREVDVYAARLGSALEQVIWPLGELGQVSLAMREAQRLTGDVDAGQALSAALETIREGARRTERGVSEGRDDAQQVIAMIAETNGKLSDEQALGEDMRRAARCLSAAAGPETPLPDAADPPVREILVAIAGLYTMAQEREIHAAFLLPGMASVTAAPSSGNGLFDDDDDGLF